MGDEDDKAKVLSKKSVAFLKSRETIVYKGYGKAQSNVKVFILKAKAANISLTSSN